MALVFVEWTFLILFVEYCFGINLYVSPNGNDNNNGLSPLTPFKTIEYTNYYINNNLNMISLTKNETIFINLMDGNFYLKKSLHITESSSSNIIYQSFNFNNKQSVISNGIVIPNECWSLYNKTNNINIYKCNIKNYTNSSNKYFRSLRIETETYNKRGIPVRYPKLYSYQNPYTRGFVSISESTWDSKTNEYNIGISNKQLATYLQNKFNNINGKISIFPGRSWINMEVNIYTNKYKNNSETSYFSVSCPMNGCDGGGPSKIDTGNRMFFYDISDIPIELNNEYYYDINKNMLYIGLNKTINIGMTSIILPNSFYIVNITGNNNKFISNITFNNITFLDSDYIAYGYQGDFNINQYKPNEGIPIDGAIRINYANNITIKNCLFYELSGSGIVISNKSNNINIFNNKFINMGQSGITIVGNSKIEPEYIYISNNTFNNIGQILSSAAGIYGSSVKNSIFKFNNITNSTRWGFEFRSDSGISSNNLISYNIIKNTGLTTGDLGGISLEGAGYTGTNITYNCIKNTVGVETNNAGDIMRPYSSKGIYLDNYSSGFYVYSNILNTQVLAGIVVHGGNNNTIINNIIYNTSELSDTRGQFSIYSMPSNDPLPSNNILLKNVYYWYNKKSVLVQANSQNANAFKEWVIMDDYNLYYIPNTDINSINVSDFTPCGNKYNDWISCDNKKYDQNSIVNKDPLFIDVQNGNFDLTNNSVLITQLKFDPLPKYISQNC